MKKIFLLILVCVGAIAHAQYFQRYFNEIVTAPPKRAEAFSDGLRSRVNYAGGNPAQYYFVGTGYSELSPPPATGPDARLRFIRTNKTGATVNVNNAYQFGDVSPLWFESRGKDLCEVDNGVGTGGYVIVGEVNDNPATGAGGITGGTDGFFGVFNNMGVPVVRERIDVGGGADVFRGVIRSLAVPGTYLVCGYSVKGPVTNAVVARINAAGVVIWLRSLDLVSTVQCRSTSVSYAYSLCEDPASGNIYVCGSVSGHKAAPDADGFLVGLTGGGGILWDVYHDLGGAADEYHDIKFTSTGNILVCGFSNLPAGAAGPFNDVWLSLFNPAAMPAPGGMIWSFKHRFAGPLQETKGYRVVERTIAGAASRYYVIGPVYPVTGAPADQMMLEVFGAGLGGGSYHEYSPPYGPLGFDDRFGLDQIETTLASAGLAIFSSILQPATGPQSDSWLAKTYYNGATCKNFCKASPDNPISLPPHTQMGLCKDTVRKVKKLKYTTYPYASALICSQGNITCGNNNSPFAENIQKAAAFSMDEMRLSPNPATNSLNISLAAAKSGAYKLEVADIEGRIVLSSVVQLNNSAINLDIAGLKKGYYLLKLKGNEKLWSKPFMKQ